MASFSWVTLVTVTLGAMLPLVLAALGGLFSERSGIVNIGLEGMMLVGAFAAGLWGFLGKGAYAGTWWGLWASLGWGALAGGVLALLHAAICIELKADQIVSGVAINILAAQSTIFLSQVFFGGKGGSGLVDTIGKVEIGGLQLSPFLFLTIAIVALTSWLVFRTAFGLRLRACGEFPEAAESAGISVRKMRYLGVIVSGMLAGVAGAVLVHEAGNFGKEMTVGRGYIALAALIFGGWRPFPTLLACALFGGAYALNFQMQNLTWVRIPSEFLNMLPYLLTMLALAGFIRRSQPPAALGKVGEGAH